LFPIRENGIEKHGADKELKERRASCVIRNSLQMHRVGKKDGVGRGNNINARRGVVVQIMPRFGLDS
jgi:hypothetical protein